ncbi:hypothetical protein HY642_01800 [Candidatus Woesearchaeota archaeon]|nr:hypothetical protein [Candidatus Woesearchaeota archaeon]
MVGEELIARRKALMHHFVDLGYSVEEVPYDGADSIGLNISKPVTPVVATYQGLEASIRFYLKDVKKGTNTPNPSYLLINSYRRYMRVINPSPIDPKFNELTIIHSMKLFERVGSDIIENRLAEDSDAQKMHEDIQRCIKIYSE